MALYSLENNILKEISENPFKLERPLQELCEMNLEKIFGLNYVKSEFSIHNFRLDTLAFDEELKAFVIIEYKRDKNFSVIDQGYAYLSVMLNNKADFILEYNENCNKSLKKADVDWSQSKIIFVSQGFTNYQKQSINFKDLPIELWEIKKYSKEIISLEQIQTMKKSESINIISKNTEEIDIVKKEIKVYTEEEHLKNSNDEIKELYDKIKYMILNFDNEIKIKFTKLYTAFYINQRNIVDLCFMKNSIKIWINLKKGEIEDFKGILKDVSSVGHWGNGDYEIRIENDDEIDYIISLIKQSYKKQTQNI